jgi:hypothetical protein
MDMAYSANLLGRINWTARKLISEIVQATKGTNQLEMIWIAARRDPLQLQNLLNQDDETSHRQIEQALSEPIMTALIKYSPEMAYNRDPFSMLTHVMRGEIFTEVEPIVR